MGVNLGGGGVFQGKIFFDIFIEKIQIVTYENLALAILSLKLPILKFTYIANS
jgi:hypothetical protein